MNNLQPWFAKLIEENQQEVIYQWLTKPRRLPRLDEFGEFDWCLELAHYFACIKPEQRALALQRLSVAERRLVLVPKNKTVDCIKDNERAYQHRMAARRHYYCLTPEQKAAKIEAQRQRNPPKGRNSLEPEVAKQRELARNRKEAAKEYQRIKADPVRYKAYLARKRQSKKLARKGYTQIEYNHSQSR